MRYACQARHDWLGAPSAQQLLHDLGRAVGVAQSTPEGPQQVPAHKLDGVFARLCVVAAIQVLDFLCTGPETHGLRQLTNASRVHVVQVECAREITPGMLLSQWNLSGPTVAGA